MHRAWDIVAPVPGQFLALQCWPWLEKLPLPLATFIAINHPGKLLYLRNDVALFMNSILLTVEIRQGCLNPVQILSLTLLQSHADIRLQKTVKEKR